jgi:hypothetical protein
MISAPLEMTGDTGLGTFQDLRTVEVSAIGNGYQFLNRMLLGRPLRSVLGRQRGEESAILVCILPLTVDRAIPRRAIQMD